MPGRFPAAIDPCPNDTKTPTTKSARQRSGGLRPQLPLFGQAAIEQPRELPRPTQRRAVTAVELVGRDAETIANHVRSHSGGKNRSCRPMIVRVSISGQAESGRGSEPGV